MDADTIDEILENQVDTLLSTVSRWDGLIDPLAEM